MTPAIANTIMVASIIGAVASTSILTAGIVVGVKVKKKLDDLETKLDNAKEATKKFARAMADI